MDLNYANGTIIIRGTARVPNSTWDERSRTFRALGLHHTDTYDSIIATNVEKYTRMQNQML